MEEARELARRLIDNVERVMVGKRREVELAVIALMAEGHLLIEDVPGVGKTMLARSLARSSGCSFRRIQFTPDLLPSDVTGASLYNQKTGDFEFRPGPIMAQIVLADEINRATPKAQSALLEAMEERQITVEGVTYPLPRPFLVLATQNSVEYEGTFPLPEAQLDRFLMRLHLGYPAPEDEVTIMERQALSHPIEALEPVCQPEDVLHLQATVRRVSVDPLVKRYIAGLVDATRRHDSVYLGASPRGSLALQRAAQARALLDGRDYVLPDDVKALAQAVLGHRLIVHPTSRVKGVSAEQVVAECLERLPVPGVRARGV